MESASIETKSWNYLVLPFLKQNQEKNLVQGVEVAGPHGPGDTDDVGWPLSHSGVFKHPLVVTLVRLLQFAYLPVANTATYIIITSEPRMQFQNTT